MKSFENESLSINVEKTDANYSKPVGVKRAKELGVGRYSIRIKVTAKNETVFIPASIGSGRVSTGFVYQIEGTEKGSGEAEVTSVGKEILVVTSGSISFWKIPPGKTASIKIYIQVKGSRIGDYKVVLSRVNYKTNTNDLRYKRFPVEISTGRLQFR